jgi:nicotinamidase-related amidase
MNRKTIKLLLVIDMQIGFKESKSKRVISECQKLIQQAIKNKDKIVILEYVDFGETRKEIKDALGNYKVKYIIKNTDDGGDHVHSYLQKRNWQATEIKVCGICLSACVRVTSERLADMGYEVAVIKKACDKEFYEEGLPSHKNLVLA